MLWEIIVKGYNPIKSVCPLSCMHIIYYESFTVIWALILMANSNYVAPILKVRDTVGFQNIVVLHIGSRYSFILLFAMLRKYIFWITIKNRTLSLNASKKVILFNENVVLSEKKCANVADLMQREMFHVKTWQWIIFDRRKNLKIGL